MGMFDRINYEMDCPKCGTKINTFVSKDGPCIMARLEFREVDYFYAICKNCGAWVGFTLNKPRPQYTIEDYDMEVKDD